MKYLILLLLLIPIPAIAETITASVQWLKPTSRNDGSPLPGEQIVRYNVFYSIDTVDGQEGDLGNVAVTPSNGTSLDVVLELPPGNYVFRLAITTIDNNNYESEVSEIQNIPISVVSNLTPNPPTNILINFSCEPLCTVER